MDLIQTNCCGLYELDGVFQEEPTLLVNFIRIVLGEGNFKGRFIVFSDVPKESKGGNDLASYILKNKLGLVYPTRGAKNPNSKNMLKVWIWEVNLINLKKHT